MDFSSVLRNTKIKKTLILIFIIVLFKTDIMAIDLTDINKNIKDAEFYYWIGMEENGDMKSYQKGLLLLDTAEESLKALNVPEKKRENILAKISGLRTDIEQQADIAHDTLIGVFPMIRMLNPSLFWDSLADKTYELNDDPAVIATTVAIERLVKDVLVKWKQHIQLNVIVNSFPKNKALENEILYVLNTYKKFFIHNDLDIVSALTEEEYKVYISNNSDKKSIKKLAKAFNTSFLLEITINELNVVNNDHLYLINGTVHDINKSEPLTTFSTYGFCRDRTGQLYPILITNVFLFSSPPKTVS